jgi:hypothetical protein
VREVTAQERRWFAISFFDEEISACNRPAPHREDLKRAARLSTAWQIYVEPADSNLKRMFRETRTARLPELLAVESAR